MIDFSGRAMRAGTRGVAVLAAVAGFAVLPQLAHQGTARADGSGGSGRHHHHPRGHRHRGTKQRPGVALDAKAPRGRIVPGRTYRWPYSVTNNGAAPVRNVTLATTPDHDLKVVATPPKCTWRRKSELVCRIGLIPRGQTRRGSIAATVNPKVRVGKSLGSPARLSWQSAPADVRTQAAAFPPVAVSPATDLTVRSTAPEQIGSSDAPYRISVTNDGPVTAESVVVRAAVAAQRPDTACGTECATQRLNIAACQSGCAAHPLNVPACEVGCGGHPDQCPHGCAAHRPNVSACEAGCGRHPGECGTGCAAHRPNVSACEAGCGRHPGECGTGCAAHRPNVSACGTGCGRHADACGTGSCGSPGCGCRPVRPVEETAPRPGRCAEHAPCGSCGPCSMGPARVSVPAASGRRAESCGGSRGSCVPERPLPVAHPRVPSSPVSIRHHRRCVAQGTGFVCSLGGIPPGRTRTLQLAVHGRRGAPARRFRCLSTVRSGTPDSNMANNRSACHTHLARPLPARAGAPERRSAPEGRSAPERRLPVTGGSFDAMALWGLGLAGAGLALFGLGRRRRGEQG